MALSSVVRGPFWQRIWDSKFGDLSTTGPLLWAAFLTVVVAGPWLLPGYVFGTDWPGPRRIAFPNEITSSALLQAVLSLTGRVIGGELTGKLLVIASLFAAGAVAYRAAPGHQFISGAVAATIYVLNPFVYSRLHYGQLYLIAGYAVLPWVVVRLRILAVEPTIRTALLAALALAVLGVLSIHLFFASALLIGALGVAYLIGAGRRAGYSKNFLPKLVLAIGASLGLSSYWIVPALTSRGYEGLKLAGIGSGDLAAFAAVPDPQLGLIPNLLGLYGFWAEATNRFTSMKHFVPGWPAVLAVVLLLAAIGLIANFTRKRREFAPWAAALAAAAAIALVLEMGVSHPATAGLVRWLDATFPPYRGMRDAGKWAAILALAYSQLGGLGAAALLGWLRGHIVAVERREWAASVATALLLAVPLYYGNGLLYGSHGEIKASPYPAGWYAADQALTKDPHPGKTLFLPWHEYMSYSFIRNENKVIASPAPTFFSVPIVASQNPEVIGIPPPTDPEQVAVSQLVHDGPTAQWSKVLAGDGVKYILLAHDLDWSTYAYLDTQRGVMKVADLGSITLYAVRSP